MVVPQATLFWQLAIQSGLIDAHALKACWEKIPPAKRTPEAADRRLARQAVDAGLLTLWQAQQIVNGRSSGFKIDKYILLDRIGTGGMGRVYLARDTRLGRRVAIKLLSPERLNNPRALARFLREAKVGAQLQHENLVRMYDEGESNGVPYLVMEYIEGKTVARLITDNGPIPPPVAAGMARQVALGLEHAYQKGLIHRDVNPMNIIVTREGVAKLTDLGLALDTAEDGGNVTRDGVTVGTFDYISPEQARHSRNVDTRTDIYSLGCSLYHMIAGQVPFPSPSLPEKLYAHQAAEPTPLSSLVSGVPAGLEAVVRRMMHKSPDERYATPLAVAMALEPYQGVKPSAFQFEPDPPPAAARPEPSRPAPTPEPGMGAGTASGEVDVSDPDLVAAPTPLPEPPEPERNGRRGAAAAPRADGPGHVEAATPAAVGAATGANGPDPAGPAAEDLIEIEEEDEESDVFPVARPAQADAPAAAALGSAEDDAIEVEDRRIPNSDVFPVARPTAPASGLEHDPGAILPSGDAILEPLREPPARGGPLKLAINAVATLMVIALAAAFIYRAYSRRTAPEKGRNRIEADDGRGPGLAMPKGASIVVHLPDGSTHEETDLLSALKRVAPGGGEIALSGPKLIKADEPLDLSGKVVIRPAAKATTILLVEMSTPGPLFRSRAGGSLALEGLTVSVTLQGRASAVVVQADGDLDVRRCLFMASGKGDDARAIVAQGPKTTIEGCGFRGFDRPVELGLGEDARAGLSNCLFAWSRADDHKTGWAVRARTVGAAASKGLTLDHCTFAGGGPIEVAAGAAPATPHLPVQVQNTAVLADAMLLWGPPPKEFPGAIPWTGKGNRYDIQKAVWVVLPPNGFDGLPGGPVDSASWGKVMPEAGTTVKSFRFAADGSAAAFLQPDDYVIADKDAAGIGIDPRRVGPAGR